jgi:hypothetical protein
MNETLESPEPGVFPGNVAAHRACQQCRQFGWNPSGLVKARRNFYVAPNSS